MVALLGVCHAVTSWRRQLGVLHLHSHRQLGIVEPSLFGLPWRVSQIFLLYSEDRFSDGILVGVSGSFFPSCNTSVILPSFHSANLFAKHSWWSLALDFWLGFCSPTTRRTKAAFKAICWLSTLLFQSFKCFVSWSSVFAQRGYLVIRIGDFWRVDCYQFSFWLTPNNRLRRANSWKSRQGSWHLGE